jgi:hypothetical protein
VRRLARIDYFLNLHQWPVSGLTAASRNRRRVDGQQGVGVESGYPEVPSMTTVATATIARPTVETIADLVERLGGIPLELSILDWFDRAGEREES